jgi:hypothetical protein
MNQDGSSICGPSRHVHCPTYGIPITLEQQIYPVLVNLSA